MFHLSEDELTLWAQVVDWMADSCDYLADAPDNRPVDECLINLVKAIRLLSTLAEVDLTNE